MIDVERRIRIFEGTKEITIRPLRKNEIDAAVEIFFNAIKRDWKKVTDEERDVIRQSFHSIVEATNPHRENSLVIGAFDVNRLIGTSYVIPINFFLGQENRLLSRIVKRLRLGREMTFFGGTGVHQDYLRQGISKEFSRIREDFARKRGFTLAISETSPEAVGAKRHKQFLKEGWIGTRWGRFPSGMKRVKFFKRL